jgi:hypothetical protein
MESQPRRTELLTGAIQLLTAEQRVDKDFCDWESCYLELADQAFQVANESDSTRQKHEVHQKRRVLRKQGLHPLCYEHHAEMRPGPFDSRVRKAKSVDYYACTRRGCLVGYGYRRGYFLIIRANKSGRREIIPHVSCPDDGRVMYLARVKPKRRSFRLWRCPQCEERRTNKNSSGE